MSKAKAKKDIRKVKAGKRRGRDAAEKSVVFIVDGGIGKCIMSTVVIRGIKKKYPDRNIVVLSGYPDIFNYNPNVYRPYFMGNTTFFYDDYIVDQDAEVLKSEPYYARSYLRGDPVHLTRLWCEQLDVPFDNPKPDLFFSKQEKRQAAAFIKQKPKPIFFIQFEGGKPPSPNEPPAKMFIRSLPIETVQAVVNDMKKDFHVMVMKAATQAEIEGAESVSYPLRLSLALMENAEKLLLIDSMGQHAAAALGKKAVVCWSGTDPARLGYESHINLTVAKKCPDPFCHRPNSYLFDRDGTLNAWECPYDEVCTEFDAADILKALK